jgi:hypothetical protein
MEARATARTTRTGRMAVPDLDRAAASRGSAVAGVPVEPGPEEKRERVW